MVEAVKNNLDKIIEACKQMQVQSLYLVGSGARVTDFTFHSDLDFVYTMRPDARHEKGFDFFDFWFLLEEITGRKVDLIAEERIRNKFLKKSLSEDKIKIYEAQPFKIS